jgi:HlyD family secretion protein
MKERGRFLIVLAVLFTIAGITYWVRNVHSSDIVLVGTVDANQVVVSARITGRLDKLNVTEGSEVKVGDVIAELDTQELEAQRSAAKATLSSMSSRISQTESEREVASGETSSGVSNAQSRVQTARANLQEALATLEQARLDNERTQGLAEQGIVSAQERDRAAQQLKAQQARVAALQDQVRAAQADVKAAQARTHQARAAQSTVAATRAEAENARAQLEQAQARLGYTKVLAPVAGTVSVRVARQGEVVNPGSAIVTIVDYNDTWVHAALPETLSDRVGIGDNVRVRLPSGAMTSGKVILKEAEGDFATQRDVNNKKRDIKTVVLRVRVDNSEKKLVPGMTAEVLLPGELEKAARK